jgi:hypothetical protein
MPGSTAAGSPPVGRAARPTASSPTPTRSNSPNSANAGHVRPGDAATGLPAVERTERARIRSEKGIRWGGRSRKTAASPSCEPMPPRHQHWAGTKRRTWDPGAGWSLNAGRGGSSIVRIPWPRKFGSSARRGENAVGPTGGGLLRLVVLQRRQPQHHPVGGQLAPKPRGRRPFPVVRACGSTDQACGRAWLTSCRARPGAVLSASPGPERRGSGCSRSRGCCRRLRAGSAR